MNELLATALVVIARLSWYDPALCDVAPVNCFDPDRWWNMAAGHDARTLYWQALACPSQFPLGTQFIIDGSRWGLADGMWECLDRGGAIIIDDDGLVWLDLLTDTPIWADVLPVQVILPGDQDASRFDCCVSLRSAAPHALRSMEQRFACLLPTCRREGLIDAK